MRFISRFSGLALSLLLLPCVFVGPALARQTIVTGTADVSYDFRARSYDQAASAYKDEGDKQKIGIGPEILIVSKGIYDTFSFNYAPLFNYDFVTDTSGVDHKLNVKGERFLSRSWSFSVADDFIRSDDPSATSTAYTPDANGQLPTSTGNELSRDLSGEKYWTNTASAKTTYALAENSRIAGGYTYSVLRNDSGGTSYEDYDKHAFSTDLTHGFNFNWRSSLGLNYTRGLYNNLNGTSGSGTSTGSPDLNEYQASFGVDYVDSVKDSFPLKYTYSTTQYDGDSRPNNLTHQWSGGWDHAFDVRTRMTVGGGPSYAETEGLDGTWGYNAYLTFNKTYEHATCFLQFNKQYESRNFTGSATDAGLTDTYSTTAQINYQYTEALAFDVHGRYSLQSTLDQGVPTTGTTGDNSSDKNMYEAGFGLNYSFARWYKAGVKYVYYISDGTTSSDQYTDHQVLFTLSATKEFWRW